MQHYTTSKHFVMSSKSIQIKGNDKLFYDHAQKHSSLCRAPKGDIKIIPLLTMLFFEIYVCLVFRSTASTLKMAYETFISIDYDIISCDASKVVN